MDAPTVFASRMAFMMTRFFVCLPLILASPALAAAPSAQAALGLKPVQPGIEYDQVTGSDVDQCKVSDIERDDWSGWEVFSSDGTILRRFADTNGDKRVDLWCYFQYGVEVYRDIDANFNGKADQYRWLGTAGIRWGLDSDEDGTIDRWKMISAEEVTKELIQALGQADTSQFTNLLATTTELKAAGIEGDRLESISRKITRAAGTFRDFARSQKVIGSDARWVQFAAAAPGVVPSGEPGIREDVIAYENAVAMFESKDTPGQLLVGTLLKVDDTWKLLDLPVLAEPGQPIAQSGGVFFSPGAGANTSVAGNSPATDSQTQKLVSSLESIDSKLAQATDARDMAKLNDQRAEIVQRLMETAANDEERETWTRQLVDTVSVAVQSGAYPNGLKRLQDLAKSLARQKGDQAQALRAYTEYQLIGTEYIARQDPKADFAKIQEWWLGELNDFADRYPQAPETAQAKLQLALSKEFEDKERDALSYYKEVARDFRGTEAAQRAAGAVRRLESVGKEVDLQGQTVDGKTFRLSQLRGRPVILHYWASWCEPCKQDMKRLRSLQARYQRAGLQLVGVNIDNSREQAIAYLKEASLPWTQLYEDGGLEGSPLAMQFGVQTLPTMMLIDQKGRVVRHNVREAELEDELNNLLQASSKR